MSLFEDASHMGYVPDRLKKAEKRLEQNAYDVEAWSIVLRDAQNKKIEDARPQYEKIVTQFPSSGRYWKLYVEHEVFILTLLMIIIVFFILDCLVTFSSVFYHLIISAFLRLHLQQGHLAPFKIYHM